LLSACVNNNQTISAASVADTPSVAIEVMEPAVDPSTADTKSAALGSGTPEIPGSGIALNAFAADNIDDACVGKTEITVEPDALLFFCVQVANLGEVPLTDVEVLSKDADVDLSTFTALKGSFDHIDPGGVLLATMAEPVVDGRFVGELARDGLNVWLQAGATSVDSTGVDLEQILADSQVFVRVQTDGSSTGPASAMASGTDALFDVGSRMFLALEILIPSLGIVALMAVGIWWACCRRSIREHSEPQ
jgi:hypothetical protein